MTAILWLIMALGQQAHMPVCLDDLVPSTNGRCERIRSGWILVPCREELKPSCFSNAKGEWFLEPLGQAQQAQKKIPEFSGSGYTNGTCYVTPGYNGEKYTIVPCLPSETPFDVPPVEEKRQEPIGAFQSDIVGQAQAAVCGNGTIEMPDGRCFIPAPLHRELLPPFDVPPVETQVPYNQSGVTNLPMPIYSERRSCADKSRFLLMSEDGKWHCLALGRQP
jgi:hypothetical protein